MWMGKKDTMAELPKCRVEGCEKKARSMKGGYCIMHYTRWRIHGDTEVNLYKGRKRQEWILPDGTAIRVKRKIEDIEYVIDQIKNKRLLGYQKDDEDTLDIIAKRLDDVREYRGILTGNTLLDHITKPERGVRTRKFARYIETLANSDWGFENGLITLEQADLISKVVVRLSESTEPLKLRDVCDSLGIGITDRIWLGKAFTKHPIIGIIYDGKTDFIQFTKDINQIYTETDGELFYEKTGQMVLEPCIRAGLHYERIPTYKKCAKST